MWKILIKSTLEISTFRWLNISDKKNLVKKKTDNSEYELTKINKSFQIFTWILDRFPLNSIPFLFNVMCDSTMFTISKWFHFIIRTNNIHRTKHTSLSLTKSLISLYLRTNNLHSMQQTSLSLTHLFLSIMVYYSIAVYFSIENVGGMI